MWRRALLAAAAVSYLICVLVLSGLQKEDLDVSMLGKLRRFDVKLDDINNEQIRQQCISRNNELMKGSVKEITEVYTSTTEYKPTISAKDPLPSKDLNMGTIMKYFKTREDSTEKNDYITEKTASTRPELITNVGDRVEEQPKIDMESLRRFIQVEAQKKSFYKLDDESDTVKHDTAINLKTNQRNLFPDEATMIDKLIKSYLLNKQKLATTTEPATTRFTINIQNIYKQIDEIIVNRSNADIEKQKTTVNYQDNGGQSNKNHIVISPKQVPQQSQEKSYPMGKQLYENFYNFLSGMNPFKNNSSRLFPNYDKIYYKDKPQSAKLLGSFNQNAEENNKETTTPKLVPEKELDQRTLTPSLVKEIAETVKNVIIKDLRKELAEIQLKTTITSTQITSTTIRTTTETAPTTTSKSKIQENDLAIMEKFMDLYEQIKSLNQVKYLLSIKNESMSFVKKLKIPSNSPQKDEMIMPTFNRLQIQEPRIFVTSVGHYNTKPSLNNYNTYVPRRENNHPITIQTNSVEIQPLPVPLSKPESMIRQNIVVHSGNHYQGGGNSNHKYLNSRTRYTDSDSAPPNPKNRTYNYNPLKRYEGYYARYPTSHQQKQREDVIRFRVRDNGNSRIDTDYYEKIDFGNNNGNNNNNGRNENRGIFNKYPRFHERLERADPGSAGTPHVSDVDVKDINEQNSDLPSRHQLSLVDMKKGTSYDDTHFKNFLRSQQKVTDILERILATRPRTNTPLSFEAI